MELKKDAQNIFNRLKTQLNDTILTVRKESVQHVKFSNSKINTVKNWNTYKIGIFGALGNQVVFNEIRDTTINPDAIAHTLVQLAKVSAENKDYHGIAKGPFAYKQVAETYDKKIEFLGNKIFDLTEKGINAALKEGAARVAGVMETCSSETLLLTSGSIEVKEKETYAYFSLRAFKEKDASGHNLSVSCTLNKLDVVSAATRAARTAVLARSPVHGIPGKFDVLFDPLPFANLLEMVGNSASIFNVESGLSFFQNSLNKKVAASLVTIYDNGRLNNGLGSGICDDEGVPTQATPVIQEGIFRNYLHNTSTAKKYGVKSTGNAGLIAPEPTTTILEPGKEQVERMMEGIRKGIYVTNVWYTRAQNMMTGDFSTIPRDGIFSIENGKIKHAIKNIRISENMVHILQNIVARANNSEQIRGWEVEHPVVTPSVMVKALNITRPLEI